MSEERLSLLLPASIHDKLNDLVPGRGKRRFLEQLIRNHDGTNLFEDAASGTVFRVSPGTIEALQRLQAQNNIRSANMTVKLLIELAWERKQAEKAARLLPKNHTTL